MFIPKYVAVRSGRIIYFVYWLQICCLLSVLYICPSVRPHGTTCPPPDEFSRNPVIGDTGPWSVPRYSGGLTNFSHVAFTAVPVFCIFFRPTSVSILWRTCVYIHTYVTLYMNYQITLQWNIFTQIRAVLSVNWLFIIRSPAWRLLGEYVTLDRTFCSLFKPEVVAASITSTFTSFSPYSRRTLLRIWWYYALIMWLYL